MASSLSASSSFIPSIVFGHPAGLIQEHPNDAILFLRARNARSSKISAAKVSLVASAEAPGRGAAPPVRYCALSCRRAAWAWLAETEVEDDEGSVCCEEGSAWGPNHRSCDFSLVRPGGKNPGDVNVHRGVRRVGARSLLIALSPETMPTY
ncbi:hypothetical protein BDW68DRAFT_162773 [Aspergillus falconensis]